jgi:hypothetical protein
MDHAENTASVVEETCLPHRCLAIDVLLSRLDVFTVTLPGSGYNRRNILDKNDKKFTPPGPIRLLISKGLLVHAIHVRFLF